MLAYKERQPSLIESPLMDIYFYNTRTRRKDKFTPLDATHVGLYVCGPTVYDRIHIGNARPLVVFDLLARLLRHHYPAVTYVRNITDIDDKINARAAERNISIDRLCEDTIASFHQDAAALLLAPPDIQPHATHHIPQMIQMIETLLEKGFAYEASGHVLFATDKMASYGQLSGRSLDEMIAGARVEPAPYKKNPADFVLWKPSSPHQPKWPSPWGAGRPGWHIECSAMSAQYLGTQFDIHAGGLDLIFPHHENEIAQSCCAHGTDYMAGYWLHNGYVTVEGKKMSKSLGNFTTIEDALKRHRGEAIRLALLSTHYRAPFDYSDDLVHQATQTLIKFYRATIDIVRTDFSETLDTEFMHALCDDLNTPLAITRLHYLAAEANKGNIEKATQLKACGQFLGLLPADNWFTTMGIEILAIRAIEVKINQRDEARKNRDFAKADEIRDELAEKGYRLLDTPDGTTWEPILPHEKK